MSEDLIIRVIIVILGLIGGFLTLLTVTRTVTIHTIKLETRRLEENSLQNRFDRFTSSLLRVLEILYTIDDYLDSIFLNTKVDRVLFLLATVKEGGFAIVSVIHERHRINRFDLRSRYKRLPVDKEYQQMLLEIQLHEKLEVEVDLMPESFLKEAYKKEGVSSVAIHYVGKVPIEAGATGILYFSFGSYHPEMLEKKDYDYITALFASIKDVLKIYVKM